MSLTMCGAVLTVVVLLVCLDCNVCATVGKTKDLVVIKGIDETSTVGSDVEKRIINGNVALDVRESREGSVNPVQDSGKKKKKKSKKEKGFMEKMLPMMVIPFLVSTTMIPMMLISLKLMILKSAFIGKIAILLMLINMFRRRTNGEGGVFNHNINSNDVAMEHYGYHGDEEYGAYVNRRKRRSTFGWIKPS